MSPLSVSPSPAAEACVWMQAGLLSYKLCDRRFDCEHCPLDAALRGGIETPSPRPTARLEPEAEPFPEGRLYTPGHTWLGPCGDDPAPLRFGLDRFAAALISRPRRLRWRSTSRVLRPRAAVCELELEEGVLRLGTPVAARPGCLNRVLLHDPAALVTAPYGRGWIVELVPAGGEDRPALLSPRQACARAALDLRRLRRRIAHHLLSDAGPEVRIAAGGTASLTDLRLMLGAPAYLRLVRELIR